MQKHNTQSSWLRFPQDSAIYLKIFSLTQLWLIHLQKIFPFSMPVREFGRFYPILHSNQMSWLANLTLHVTLQIEPVQFPESAHKSI